MTNELRGRIVRELMRETAHAEMVNLATEETALAEELRVHLIGDKHFKVFEKLPKELVKTDRKFQIGQYSNEVVRFYYKGKPHELLSTYSGRHNHDELAEKRRIPYEIRAKMSRIALDNASLWERITKHRQKVERLTEQMQQMYSKMKSTMASIKSLKRLEEDWPEAYQLVPEELRNAGESVDVVIPIKEMRALMDRFPDEGIAA